MVRSRQPQPAPISHWLAALWTVSLSCGRVDVDVEGKRCPCPDGFDCDTVCAVCVKARRIPGEICAADANGAGGGGAGGTGGTPGGGSGGAAGSPCTPKITVQNFAASWSTPESIRWTWKPSLPASAQDQFVRYEVLVSDSNNADLVFGPTTNPELGMYVQPNGGADLTNATVTRGLAPGKGYTGRLRVMDTAACVFESTSVPAPVTPLPQGGEAKLFGEPAPSGTPFSDITHVKDGAGCLTGSNCLRTNDCKSGQCFANLTWVFDTPLLLGLSEGQFTQAYLEVFVRSTSAAPLSWCEVWLGVGSAPDRYRLSGFSVPSDGKYHKLQFPLRVLELQSKLLDYAVLAPGVRQVNLTGSASTAGGFIWADEAYVRW